MNFLGSVFAKFSLVGIVFVAYSYWRFRTRNKIYSTPKSKFGELVKKHDQPFYPWLGSANGHLQTILGSLAPTPDIHWYSFQSQKKSSFFSQKQAQKTLKDKRSRSL